MNATLERAIGTAGSAGKLGEQLDPPVTNQAVAIWKKQGWCPVDRARQIEALYPDCHAVDMVKPSIAALLSDAG